MRVAAASRIDWGNVRVMLGAVDCHPNANRVISPQLMETRYGALSTIGCFPRHARYCASFAHSALPIARLTALNDPSRVEIMLILLLDDIMPASVHVCLHAPRRFKLITLRDSRTNKNQHL